MGVRLDSYNLGKKLAVEYKDMRDAYMDTEFEQLIGWNNELAFFFNAGFKGAECPYWTTGWRYGDIPESGYSRNYKDNKKEPGVSMMEVTKNDGTMLKIQDEISGLFIKADGRKVVKCEGWLNTYATGSDGEPLLMCAEEVK